MGALSKVAVVGTIGIIAVGAIAIMNDDELKARLKEQILTLFDASGSVISTVKKMSEEFSSKAEGYVGTAEDIAAQWKTVEARVIK